MSLSAWKKKYYPVGASKVSKAGALDHSIRKWPGLSPAVLKRYGLTFNAPYIRDDVSSFSIDADSCALCVRYYEEDGCGKCPLYRVRGDVRCDHVTEHEIKSPFFSSTSNGDNRPMLRWLRKAKKMEGK